MSDVIESKEQLLIRYRDKELRGCTIKKLWLQGVSLIGADLSDVTFEDCSLDESNLTGATLNRTKFLRTSARSTNMTSATLNRAVFTDCNLTELCLEKALVEGTEFKRCDMDNLHADKAYFGNCSLFPNRAYGIKRMVHDDADTLAAAERDLEHAWEAGLVEMHVLYGPSPASGVSANVSTFDGDEPRPRDRQTGVVAS